MLTEVSRTGRSPVFDEDDVKQEAALTRLTRGFSNERFATCDLARRANHIDKGRVAGAGLCSRPRPAWISARVIGREVAVPATHVRDADIRDLASACMRLLSKNLRAVIFLRYWCEMSQREVAKELKISNGQACRLEQKAMAEMAKVEELRKRIEG
jgi:RNA polymerase sigma factor (sigma-70 family)